MAFPLRERTDGRERTDDGGASRPRAWCGCARALRVNANIATTHQEEEAATDWAGTELLGEISPRGARRRHYGVAKP